ncbi:MAG: BamA/TamA family outer membrane protein [Bacteroidaceae bacterium]|nr:BamA/TamA family outer membrane protein [Bacteroidaceae bacterium]
MLPGSVISYGNSFSAPLSEAFYSGGPNSIRAFPSRSLGPGNYRSTNKGDDPYFFHGGETRMEINSDFSGGLSHDFLNGTALGTGFGVRFVFQSLVVRLDMGIALHAPYDTGKSGYYNIPSFWKDGVRLNFAIGYPF